MMLVDGFDGREVVQGAWTPESGWQPVEAPLPEETALALAKRGLGVDLIKRSANGWMLFSAPADVEYVGE